MPNLINRAPQVPRNIRDLRPKRQLARNGEKKEEQKDEEWWYRANNSGGSGPANLRVTAASTLNNRSENSSDTNADISNSQGKDNVPRNGIFCMFHTIFCIFRTLMQILMMIRTVPRQKRRKRFVFALVMLVVWRVLYSFNLSKYSYSSDVFDNDVNKFGRNNPLITIKSMNDESDDALPFMLGDPKPQTNIASTSLETNLLRGSGNSASNTKNILQQVGMKSMSRVVSEDSQKMSKSMGDSILIGANIAVASHAHDSLQSQTYGFAPTAVESTKVPRTVPQNHAIDWSQSLRAHSLFGDSQTILNSDLIESPVDHLSNESRNANDDEDTSIQVASKRFTSTQHELSIEANNQSFNGQKRMSDYMNDLAPKQNSSPQLIASGSDSGLDCSALGGTFDKIESTEIAYWRDIPTDATFTSPYYNPKSQDASGSFNIFLSPTSKYLTFEMDDAAWKNIRLVLENAMLLAHSMGRTLVIPPRQQILQIGGNESGKSQVAFTDFFDIEAIAARQKGLHIISMEQFLEREGLQGNLRSNIDVQSEVVYPPNNRIKWDNQLLDSLWEYLRNVSKSFPSWNPNDCLLAFSAADTDEQHLFSMMADVLIEKDGRPFPHYGEYQGRPVNVDAPIIERFREILAGRRKLCTYDQTIHDINPVVHFRAEQGDGTRLMTQFYAFMWFEDWRHALWSKRFIRDSVRYRDEVMCIAARIVSALRLKARNVDLGNIRGDFDAIHIQRGEFQQQYPTTDINAIAVLTEMKEVIVPGSTVFITTNENDLSFFAPIQEVYNIIFLSDFGDIVSGINPNYFPLVEQIVASRASIFIGTHLSTFSAYIARLRGYYGAKELQDGYMTGGLQSTYLVPSKWKKEFRLYQAAHKPFFGREFPIAWRDIDRLDLPTRSLQ